MAWIETIAPAEATAELAEVYAKITTARAGVANIHRAQSLNPRAMRAHMELYKSVMFARSPLSRAQRERIGTIVSATNGCAYCVHHHAEAARQLGDTDEVTGPLSRGELPEALPEADRALLAWAASCTRDPSSATEEQAERLRALGWSARAILDASLVVGYFSFVNRIVLMLGVDLESDFARYCADGAG